MTSDGDSPAADRKSNIGARSRYAAGMAAKATRLHRGDIMSPETRSRVMARIKGRDTKPELAIAALLLAEGLEFESHVRDLPGRPDFVFRLEKVAVFCDGDFWHGWRFPLWRLKLSEKWEAKIAMNRKRDVRNHRRLRRAGWFVVRLWEHQIERAPERWLMRVLAALRYECSDPASLAGSEEMRSNSLVVR